MSDEEIVDVVRQITELLERFKRRDKANWLSEHLDAALTTPDFEWSVFRSQLHRLTIGMGSLSDIYLKAPEGSGQDEKEANNELHELTQTLWRLTK